MTLMEAPAIDAVTDERHVARALDLASLGWGRVAPNPMVGAVVTDASGAVVAEGWHAEYGRAHAEAIALEAAGRRAHGGTLYVTLEPCNHHGKTPPCTEAVLRSGVARVVVALRDPNPVAAGGLERIAAAGVEVVTGVGARAAADQNAAFLHWHRKGTPWVALKHAMSVDGRIAAAPGVRTQLTGAEAQAEVHRLRAGFDAIMVGSRTAQIDDPLLTVRGSVQPRRAPIRIVLDSEARLAPDSRLLTDGAAPTWLLAAHDAADRGWQEDVGGSPRLVRVRRSTGGGLDLGEVMSALAARDVRSVLCEGGGRLGSALLAAGLVDRLYLFVAPALLGSGPNTFTDVAPGAWRPLRSERFGADVLIELASD